MKNFPFLLMAIIFFSSCNKENMKPSLGRGNGRSGLDSTECFIAEIDSINIIKEITADRRNIHFQLESNEWVRIRKGCVLNYSVQPESWNVELLMKDSSIINLPFLGNSFHIADDSIFLNPSGFAPLTALVKFNTPVPRKIKVSIEGKSEKSADISHIFEDNSIKHEIPVYGLYPEYQNTVEISVLDYFNRPVITHSLSIQTEPVKRVQSGEMSVIENNYSPEQKNRLFLIQNAIYDGAGDIRWYTDHGGQKYYRLTKGLIGIQAFPDKAWIGEGPDIKIINLLGEIVDTFDVPHRMHHEINEKTSGGNLLVATNAEPYFTTADDTEDMIIEIDRESGAIVKEWDLRDIFDKERERIWIENVNDWCHLNSIEYDSTDNTLLISSKLQYFLSKIDYETGAIKWICGNHENWKEPWQPYLLEPVNFDTTEHPDHDWTYAQHMPRLTGRGTFMVYDNGMSRPGTDYTRAVEYRVDTENMTVEKVWSYDLNDAARSLGSVQIYDDYSVQIGHGNKGYLYEVSRDKEILFKGKLMTFYRSYAIRLYPD